MSPEKWEEMKNNLKRNFAVLEEGREDLLVETGEGPVKQGEAQFAVLDSPLGRIKLQLQEKPRLEEKKYHYSHRAGTGARVEYKFSPDELVYTFKVYKWNDDADEWKEIDPSAFNL